MTRNHTDPHDLPWQIVLAHLSRLIEAGVRPIDVGVITPYNGQVALLRELRPASLGAVEINSVDGFQGAIFNWDFVSWSVAAASVNKCQSRWR
jgi:hypothetical protein